MSLSHVIGSVCSVSTGEGGTISGIVGAEDGGEMVLGTAGVSVWRWGGGGANKALHINNSGFVCCHRLLKFAAKPGENTRARNVAFLLADVALDFGGTLRGLVSCLLTIETNSISAIVSETAWLIAAAARRVLPVAPQLDQKRAKTKIARDRLNDTYPIMAQAVTH